MNSDNPKTKAPLQNLPVERINPATGLGAVHLNVSELGPMVEFYRDLLGFSINGDELGLARLGAGAGDLLVLHEEPKFKRFQGGAGLYHFAILVSRREDLAQMLRNIIRAAAPIHGIVDHRSSDAIYLADPEGNGVELNWDHPRDTWPEWNVWLKLGNGPLDPEELLESLKHEPDPWPGLPKDSRIGHIHLHAHELALNEAFYRDVIGFDINAKVPRQAVFSSAGGYHHHVAFNVWNGVGAEKPPVDALGLKYFTIEVPAWADVEGVARRARMAEVLTEGTDEGLWIKDPSNHLLLIRKA